jgi:translation initiation factor 1A
MAFTKFKDHSKANSYVPRSQQDQVQIIPTRVRLPRGKEVIGIITQRVGGSRMQISCMDGKTRNCRVPGRLKRELWLREGDAVIVEPWEFEGDTRGDIIFKYSKNEAEKLRRDGLLKTTSQEF